MLQIFLRNLFVLAVMSLSAFNVHASFEDSTVTVDVDPQLHALNTRQTRNFICHQSGFGPSVSATTKRVRNGSFWGMNRSGNFEVLANPYSLLTRDGLISRKILVTVTCLQQ